MSIENFYLVEILFKNGKKIVGPEYKIVCWHDRVVILYSHSFTKNKFG